MKIIFKLLTIVYFTTIAVAGHAQQIADLVLTGGPSKGTYSGYPVAGTFDVTLGNNTNVNINAGAFRIVVSLPPGFVFDDAYPGIPTGWSYTKLTAITAFITPTAVVDGIPPAAYYDFSFPFKTSAPVVVGAYTAQSQSLTPTFIDPNLTNNVVAGFVNVSNTVLPVDFVNITSTITNCEAKIDWKVANQINLKQYEVESSTDGINFSTGKIIPLNGSNSYSAEMPVTGNSTYFYRVKALDLDGKFKYSAVTSAKANCDGKQGAFIMYPNPVLKGKLVNIASTINESTVYRIIDMAGKTIQEGKFTGTTSIKVSTGGTYIVDLQSSSASTKYKLVVQ